MKLNPGTVYSALALSFLTACSPPKAPAPPPPKVTVAFPRPETVSEWDEYPAHLQAVDMVEIKSRVNGYLDSIHFQDGVEVKAGDLLFVIDPRPYQADLDRASAERLRAETRLELAKNDLRRAEGLRETKAIAEEEYDSRSKAARDAQAALTSAQAAETSARLNLEYTQIKAPISGRIGRRMVTVGNLIQGNIGTGASLATIVSLDPIYCYFDADEPAFLRYRNNGSVTHALGQTNAPLACELALADETGFPHQGHVDFFDNQLDGKSGTMRMRGVFPNPDRALVPGLYATVRVPAGPSRSALLVPAVAIGSDQGLKYVLVVDKEGKIESRPVKIGRSHGTLQAVLDGVTPQDRIVVNGLMMARPGVKVEVVDTPPAGIAPKAQAQK